LVSEKLKTLGVKNGGYVPKTKRNLQKQRVTPSHNPKYTTQEPKALIANHDDSTSVKICALLET
jgi:hypothetical protein